MPLTAVGAVNFNTDEQCVDAGGEVLYALQAVRAWVAASSDRELTVANEPVLQPLLEQVRQCGSGSLPSGRSYIIMHCFFPVLTEPSQPPQATARDGSDAQWRALQLAGWLFEQPDCAEYVTWRLSASACCGDRSTEVAAALVIRRLAEVSASNGCGSSCTGHSSRFQYIYVCFSIINTLACNMHFYGCSVYTFWLLAYQS